LTSSRVALDAENVEVTVLATQGPSEPVVGAQSVRWHDCVRCTVPAGAHLAVDLTVGLDDAATAALLRTGAAARGRRVERAVDASVDRAGSVVHPAHRVPPARWWPQVRGSVGRGSARSARWWWGGALPLPPGSNGSPWCGRSGIP